VTQAQPTEPLVLIRALNNPHKINKVLKRLRGHDENKFTNSQTFRQKDGISMGL
jgi:cell division septation protein DedD